MSVGRPAYVCVIHPPPSAELTARLAPGYGLTRKQLLDVVPMVASNLPVTVEHHGIHEGVQLAAKEAGVKVPLPTDVTDKLSELAEKDGRNAIVGEVIDAWVGPSGALYGAFQLDPALTGVAHLIDNGILLGVSLTHMLSPNEKRPGSIVPYELTVPT